MCTCRSFCSPFAVRTHGLCSLSVQMTATNNLRKGLNTTAFTTAESVVEKGGNLTSRILCCSPFSPY
jgi:hypothetical protein